MISWVGHDTYSSFGNNGMAVYEGILSFYVSNSTSKFLSFNNLKAFYITEAITNKNGI